MFTVIVPVHNAEKTIKRCLESIKNQTFDDFEVIMVENGSTDCSLKICRDYSIDSPNFKLFSIGKCNGPSKPRNFGLRKSSGEYIIFLDSDDWIGERFLEMLDICFSEDRSDILFLGYCCVQKDGKNVCRFPNVSSIEKKDICLELHRQNCFGYTCCKTFRKKLLDTLEFDETMKLGEDEMFALAAVKLANHVGVIPKAYNHANYFYYVDDTTHGLMGKTHSDIIEIKNKLFISWSSFLGENYDKTLTDIADSFLRFCLWYVFEHNLNLNTSYQQLRCSSFFKLARNKMCFWSFMLKYLKWKIKKCLR